MKRVTEEDKKNWQINTIDALERALDSARKGYWDQCHSRTNEAAFDAKVWAEKSSRYRAPRKRIIQNKPCTPDSK